jgi:hypothetical protein
MADVLTERERLQREYESLKDVPEVSARLEQRFQVSGFSESFRV